VFASHPLKLHRTNETTRYVTDSYIPVLRVIQHTQIRDFQIPTSGCCIIANGQRRRSEILAAPILQIPFGTSTRRTRIILGLVCVCNGARDPGGDHTSGSEARRKGAGAKSLLTAPGTDLITNAGIRPVRPTQTILQVVPAVRNDLVIYT
jgi:hypothetical protein